MGPKVDCHELLTNGATLIDVRTSGEFSRGNVSSSKNIPLDNINQKIENIKKLKQPIILVCASGMRSGRATSILKQHGIDAFNGGSWSKFS